MLRSARNDSLDRFDGINDPGTRRSRRWKHYDTIELIKSASERLPLLVDQGMDDEFLDRELRPDLLKAACEAAGHPLILNLRPGYDHSYYFIASFIGEHIGHHAKALFQ